MEYNYRKAYEIARACLEELPTPPDPFPPAGFGDAVTTKLAWARNG